MKNITSEDTLKERLDKHLEDPLQGRLNRKIALASRSPCSCYLEAGRVLGPNVLVLLSRCWLVAAVPTGSVPAVCYEQQKKVLSFCLTFFSKKKRKGTKKKTGQL